ncbi:hypothetical protein J4573_37315 [Actinomadura barringtoniae]|uniref:ATP-binding protein n=1 Tax=Actinomadura barringtoniae TaxID=1427535 RepID=A0A939PHI7_9ACTN|nr:hypothetical protein [Actinomadura barringtoniae]MBO2452801.1 hypothetical protein [Actinomadura barringtoniae]
MKFFNTAGPCDPSRHYMLASEPRLPRARELVNDRLSFVLQGPRQTGRTTTLEGLARDLTASGDYLAIRFSCETGATAGEDTARAQAAVLGVMRNAAMGTKLPPHFMPPSSWPAATPDRMLIRALQTWAERCPRPLVLFFDEIDTLCGQSLITVLRQLRDGYASRTSRPFPRSVALCGQRDVRDHVNIKAESLRLDDFTFAQVAQLYAQHTGHSFTDQAVQWAYEASQGQPWLVNALAHEVTRKVTSELITDRHMEEAVERLIVERVTHLDALLTDLHEKDVRNVLEPMVAGTEAPSNPYGLPFVRDLGLVTRTGPLRIANPIYRQAIIRALSRYVEDRVEIDPSAFVLPDGRLDVPRLLEEFTQFWVANGEILDARETYHEAACQLVFMAFLQRVVNGGGHIDRKYAIGRRRVDITVRKPFTDADGKRAVQWTAIELKVWRQGGSDPLDEGLAQLDAYLDRLGLKTGTLVIFDRRPDAAPIHERTATITAQTPSAREITLIRA